MTEQLQTLIKDAYGFFSPPPKLTLSEWAEKFGVLSAESSAEPGKWHNLPYQVGIMNAMTDPTVERVTLMKSARLGYTKIIGHLVGYFVHYDPCSIMVVQPTDSDAEGYSKEEIAPMIRDSPVLSKLVSEAKSKDSNNTILSKSFPGGTLSLVGANSPRGFRRVSRRIVIFDEVDGYPPSAGAEGDQIKLGIKRTEYYWNRKIISGSTPTIAGVSRIEPMFEDGDKRRYFVPCPHCLAKQVLEFQNMRWPDGQPRQAKFVCVHCQKEIEHKHKKWMVERGEWIAEKPFSGHASFHIWSAYSYAPNATWGHIAKEYDDAKREGPESLKTFRNTVLGETEKVKGDAPDHKRLWERRERWAIGTCPIGVLFLVAGVDVQKDRIEMLVVGFGERKQSWVVDRRIFSGDTALEGGPWDELDNALAATWPHENGGSLPIRMMAIDTGYNTHRVYSWARRYPFTRVLAIKGQAGLPAMIGRPKPMEVNYRGQKLPKGVHVWPVGVSVIKTELYGWLMQPSPGANEPTPTGFVHFPEYDEDFFLQLTAEQIVERVSKGQKFYEWVKVRPRNEVLDCFVYARVAAHQVGMDRWNPDQWATIAAAMGKAIPQARAQRQNPTSGAKPDNPVTPRARRRPAVSIW